MDKKTILILHGWNLSGEKYKSLVRLLRAKGFCVYSPDLPGFGKNKNLKKIYTLDDYADFVKKYLKRKNISKVTILAHSFGGRVAILFAAKNPRKIDKLVLTGVPGFVPVSKIKIIFFFFLSKIGKLIFYIPGVKTYRPTAQKILYHIAGAYDYQKTEGVIRNTFKKIIRQDLAKYMNRIQSPTFLIWGERDAVVPLSVAKRMQRVIKKSYLKTIYDEGHKLPFKNPEELIRSIETFLS